MSDQAPRLLPDTDRLLPDTDRLLEADKAAMGTVLTAYRGGDPLHDPPATGYPRDLSIELARRAPLMQQRTRQLNELFAAPDSEWNQVKTFMDGIFERYKTANEAQLIKKPRNEQEAIAQSLQMRPVHVDPNEAAAIMQAAVKFNQRMKAIDPTFSIFTHPRTKPWAEWLNRESGVGTAGFMTSGEQPVEMGVVGRSAWIVAEGVEGVKGGLEGLIHGAWDLGRRSISAMGGPDIGPSYPTNYIETGDGELVHNGGKVPTFVDSLSMLWAHATNQNVEKFAAQVGRAQEWEQANRAGLGGILTSVSRFGGELVGMGPGFGAATKLGTATMGTLTMRGAQALGTLRLGKGLGQSERALKIISTINHPRYGIGAAAGMAAYESVVHGRAEGYGASFAHGLMMAPVLMTLGALGRKAEWFAKHRANMPERAALAVAGALEGAGFAGIETIAPEVLPTAWGFIRDPNASTWETFAKNMLAFSLVKMGTGRTTMSDPETLAMRRGIGRAQFAEKVARGETGLEEIAKAPVTDEPKLRELGEVSMRSREAKTFEERTAARTRQREIEAELDVEEFGKGPSEETVTRYLETPENVERGTQRLAGMPKKIGEYDLEMKPLEDVHREAGLGTHEWTVTDPATGRKIGYGTIRSDGKQVKIEDAEVREEYRGKGIYSSIVKSLADLHGGRITSRTQSDAAKKAWERAGIKQLEVVEGKEPQPMRPRVSEPGAKAPHEEMVQEGGRAGIEPERFADEGPEAAAKAAAKEEKRVRTSVDPLEDPRFQELPQPVREEILAAKDAQERKEIFASRVTERRKQNVPRETSQRIEEPTELEARRGEGALPSGVMSGPQSLQQPPTRQIEATPGARRVEARDIFAAMEGRPGRQGFRIPLLSKRIGATEGDPVQTAMRGGKIPGSNRGVLGVSKFFENLNRTAEGRAIVSGVHEWSHSMHRHMISARGGLEFIRAAKAQANQAMQDPAVARDVATMLKDYPGADQFPKHVQWMEAWAEWHARNLLGEVGLDAKIPTISAWIRGWLAAPQQARLKDQYQTIQREIFDYNAQGSRGRLAASVVSGAAAPSEIRKQTQPSIARRIVNAFNAAMFDDMAKLKASQNKWLKAAGRRPEDVSIIEDPARLADALAMTANKTAEVFIRRGVRLDDRFVPGLEPILKSLGSDQTRRDFEQYIVAIRSMELYDASKSVQLPPQDYVESIRSLTAEHPEFPDALKRLKAWNDALIDWVVQAGNLDQKQALNIKEAYSVYVPFFRAIEGPAQHGQGRGVAERGTGLSRIKGSTYEIQDPFVALQQVTRSMVAKAHQNQVISALYKMAKGQEAGGLATIIKRTSVPTDHPLREILDKIEKKISLPGDVQHEMESVFEAIRQQDLLDPQIITTFAQKVIPTGEKSVIAFTPRLRPEEIGSLVAQGADRVSLLRENNKVQWMEVDAKAYETLMGIDKLPMIPERVQPILKVLRAPAVLTRLFATGISLPFTAANAIRDMMSASLMSPHGGFRPLGGLVDFVKGAAIFHSKGKIRDLYEELGVKTSSFWSEGRQRALIGEQQSIAGKTVRAIEKVEELIATPESYIRIKHFKDAYEGAKAAGRSEFEARMLALEAGKEITVNFARAGWLARSWNQITPYFNAGLQGQRKLWGNLLVGGVDSRSDEQRARVQRSTIINGIANITIPSMFFWWLHKDEDWYQDLPDWRKVGYINTKIGGEIISIPKPFEAGILFGGIPQIIADNVAGQNPAAVKEALSGLLGPYAQVGSVIPAFLKPIIEVSFNQNLFTGRKLTPEWISRSNPPTEQANFYTSETAKILSRALNGILTPTEVEAVLGGYTAGSAVTAMQVIDEISGMKDHPGIRANPFARFTSQQPHGQSSFVDQLYELSTKLDQTEATLNPLDAGMKRQVDTAKRKLSDLRQSQRAGRITREEAERRSYEIARPLVERHQARTR